MSIQQILQELAQRVQGAANVRTVFGDPIQAHRKTIIPVARSGFGLGGGLGPGTRDDQEDQEHGHGEGGGVGAGGGTRPVGVFEVTDEDTRFVPITPPGALCAAGLVGLLMGLLLGRRRSR